MYAILPDNTLWCSTVGAAWLPTWVRRRSLKALYIHPYLGILSLYSWVYVGFMAYHLVLWWLTWFPQCSIRDITKEVAAAVVKEAIEEDLAEGHRDMDARELRKLNEVCFFYPFSPLYIKITVMNLDLVWGHDWDELFQFCRKKSQSMLSTTCGIQNTQH